jgi:hypothetical protein
MWPGVRRRRVLLAPTRALAQVPRFPSALSTPYSSVLDDRQSCSVRHAPPCSAARHCDAAHASARCSTSASPTSVPCSTFKMRPLTPPVFGGKRLHQMVFLDAAKDGCNSDTDSMPGRKDVQACFSQSLCARLTRRDDLRTNVRTGRITGLLVEIHVTCIHNFFSLRCHVPLYLHHI